MHSKGKMNARVVCQSGRQYQEPNPVAYIIITLDVSVDVVYDTECPY